MATKRSHIDIDPDYEDVTQAQTKRQKVLEEDAKETTRKKIEMIVRSEFHQELKNKEKELDCIDQSLRHCQVVMDRLRACIVANYYGSASQQRHVKNDPQQIVPIHPAVKDTLGKRPLHTTIKVEPKTEHDSTERLVMKQELPETEETKEGVLIKQEVSNGGRTSRSNRFKVRRRIVIGNVSKYIPVDRRDENDQSTHKWMVYVRGPKGEPNIDHFVKKVWFFLHPSYRPNDLVEVSQPPFHLTRRGWGEFPVRVQLYFQDARNKKVDVIHQLKLDRTYTGLQTLGSETVIDVELEKDIEIKPSLKVTCNGPPSATDAMETNITIPEHLSPIKKEIKRENISPKLTDVKTPDKNLSKSQNISKSVSPFSPSSKQSNMTLTLGTFGSLTSRGINKPGTVETGQNGAPINGFKQQSVSSSTSLSDGASMKHSSELQKMLLQSTPSSVGKSSSASPRNAQVVQTLNSSVVKLPTSGAVNSQQVKSPQKSGNGVIPPQGVHTQSANQISQSPTQMAGSTATLGNPAQTLYIRCKDNQGNIFLVPHHLLKTVPGTPAVSQPVNSPGQKGITVSPKTLPTKGTPQKIGSVPQNSAVADVNTPANVPSSPPNSQVSTVTVQSVAQNQTVFQQSVGAKSVFQKPAVQNSQLLIRSQAPITKSNISPAPGVPSPVLLIKTEVNPARPLLTVGQPTKALDKNGKEVPQPTQLQLHLQGQIPQNQLKVTSQGLKSVQPSGKNRTSKKIETVTLIQKTDSNVENKVPSKTCQLASLLRGDIAAAHRNAVKQVSLVAGVNTTSAQVLGSQNTTQNVLVQKTVESQNDTFGSSGGLKPTAGRNLTDASSSGNQGTRLQQNPGSVISQVSLTPKTMHSVILVNQEANKMSGIPLPGKAVDSSALTQCSGPVMLTSSTKTTLAGGSPSSTVTSASINFAKQQVVGRSDLSSGLVAGSKEQVKTVIAKIGTQTLLLQLPVSESGTLNKPVEVPKVNKLVSKLAEAPSNAALIESLKKQAAEKEANLIAKAKLSYKERKLGLPVSTDPQTDPQEKRIHKWKKKSPEERLLKFSQKSLQESTEPVKDVIPLRVENYPDMQSLVRAAIKRHPIVSPSANICQHPYCAGTLEQWLSWNVGRRRASEWQRAVACQKYLKNLLNGDQFKGNQLWSAKQIVCWCRLHAYSPHYMEKTLHPTGVDFPMKNARMGDEFSSATDSFSTVADIDRINNKLSRESSPEEEVDIISTEPPKQRIKVEPQEETSDIENPFILPPSDNARFVQDVTQKIGVKFEPVPIVDDVYSSVSEDIVFKAMLGFVEDVITETFSYKVNMGRYPDGIGVVDVYKALSALPQADFLTNKQLGVKDIAR